MGGSGVGFTIFVKPMLHLSKPYKKINRKAPTPTHSSHGHIALQQLLSLRTGKAFTSAS
jgi:hypothetical protein